MSQTSKEATLRPPFFIVKVPNGHVCQGYIYQAHRNTFFARFFKGTIFSEICQGLSQEETINTAYKILKAKRLPKQIITKITHAEAEQKGEQQ